MSSKRTMQGEITRTEGEPNPHSFWIRGDDGNEYFAHLGDLSNNSDKLLYSRTNDTQFLKTGNKVQFEIWEENITKVFNVIYLP